MGWHRADRGGDCHVLDVVRKLLRERGALHDADARLGFVRIAVALPQQCAQCRAVQRGRQHDQAGYARVDAERVTPTIAGRAFVVAEGTLRPDPADPSRCGGWKESNP
jgi:hypothetical protein